MRSILLRSPPRPVAPAIASIALLASLLVALPVACNNSGSSADAESRGGRPGPSFSAEVIRGPYLQLATAKSVVLRWRTDAPTDSRVYFGTEVGKRTEEAGDEEVGIDHRVRLAGLEPSTVYYYAVGTSTTELAGGDARHWFVTSPKRGARQAVRVLALGDAGTAEPLQKAVRDAYLDFTGETRTDLWLMLGDNAYIDGTDPQYQNAVFEVYPELLRNSPVWPTLGNHDGHSVNTPAGTGPYYEIFDLPAKAQAGGVASGTEAYYSFDYANVHFVCLDSYDVDRSAGAAMALWLRDDLSANDQDWTIAYFHHPPYSRGSHDSDRERELIDMRENFAPILEAGGVDLVLSGHSHVYERSFFIDGHYGVRSTFSPSRHVVAPGLGRPGSGAGAYKKPSGGPVAHSGTVYVVAGSSGRLSGGPLDHPAMAVSKLVAGALILDIEGDRLDATFLSDAGVVEDRFRIAKR